MTEYNEILPPAGEDDQEGAERVFKDFLVLYQPTLIQVEHKLEGIIQNTEPEYADAYKPWHQALCDLVRGVYLIAKKVSLPNPDDFLDALRTFSFESAIQFLYDLGIRCKMALQPDWAQSFRKNIDILLFSISIINRNKQQEASLAL